MCGSNASRVCNQQHNLATLHLVLGRAIRRAKTLDNPENISWFPSLQKWVCIRCTMQRWWGGALLKDSNLRFTPFWNLFYSCQWQRTKYLTLGIYKSSLLVPRFWKFKGYNAGISSTLVSSQWWMASERMQCGQEGMVTWYVLLTHIRVNREG